MKICFLIQSWTKGWRQIHEVKQNRFLYEMFYSCFCNFLPKDIKILLSGGRLGTRHQIQAFQIQGFSRNFLIS